MQVNMKQMNDEFQQLKDFLKVLTAKNDIYAQNIKKAEGWILEENKKTKQIVKQIVKQRFCKPKAGGLQDY